MTTYALNVIMEADMEEDMHNSLGPFLTWMENKNFIITKTTRLSSLGWWVKDTYTVADLFNWYNKDHEVIE